MGLEKKEMTSREKIEKIRDILKNVDVYDKDEIKEVIDHVELCEIYEDMTTINTYLTEILEIIKEEPSAAADRSEISDEEAIEYLQILEKRMFDISGSAWLGDIPVGVIEKGINSIKALEQEPCEDAISRQAVIETIFVQGSAEILEIDFAKLLLLQRAIKALPSVTPTHGTCKECKWWKDSDGLYRRGGHAESQCPINRREVFEGNGYCYMFEPQESEVEE